MGFARQVQAPIPFDPGEADRENQPLLQNLLPWPDSPFLTEKELERLSSTLRVSAAGLPPELVDFSRQNYVVDRESNAYCYLRARALTFLRHRLNQVCSARLCVGGRRTRAQGRYPGVIEEALFAVRENKPLYVSALLGGAAEQVIDALDRGAMPDEFCPPSNVNHLYDDPPVDEDAADTRDDRVLNRESVWNEFAQLGYEGLSRNNGLTIDENRELHRTRVLDQVIELMLVGMSRVRAEGR